jgi:adenylate cyclase
VKVLVADDNADNRHLLEDILLGQGYSVLIARDGFEAIDLARENLPDLLILDINMPGMNGFDVCDDLKSDPNTQQIPILMLTALADIENRVKGLGLGADDYVTKPFSPRELVARIDARLRIKSDQDALRETQEIVRQTFERFVSAKIVKQLLEHADEIHLGGQIQDVTVVFADVEGFTGLAEKTEPEQMLSVLNAYHGQIVEYIQAEDGIIDKFLGDGAMALYNAPLPQPDHALRAVRSVMRLRQFLPEFRKQFPPQFQLKINFGIHTGKAVVGTVGSKDMMDYTAIGDTVNIASRIQDISHGGQTLISGAVYEQVKDSVRAEFIGNRKVKNREQPVMLYEVLELLA